MPNLQVSRIFHRQYTRPREHGRFAPGYKLWTRADKVSRWVYFPAADEAPVRERAALLTECNRRVVRDLVVIIVAFALIALFGGI
jgi:hypothetical protein